MPTDEPLGPLYSQTEPAGLVALWEHLSAKWPGVTLGGMYNPTSNLSGGGPSPHRVTQALDVMCDQAHAAAIIRYLVGELAESLNLQQCIAWHEIVTVERWDEGIRHYAPDDHAEDNPHCHIHVGLDASRHWVAPDHQEDTFMAALTEDEQRLLFQRVDYLWRTEEEKKAPGGPFEWSGHYRKQNDIHKIVSDLRDAFTGSAQRILDNFPKAGLIRGVAKLRQNVSDILAIAKETSA